MLGRKKIDYRNKRCRTAFAIVQYSFPFLRSSTRTRYRMVPYLRMIGFRVYAAADELAALVTQRSAADSHAIAIALEVILHCCKSEMKSPETTGLRLVEIRNTVSNFRGYSTLSKI